MKKYIMGFICGVIITGTIGVYANTVLDGDVVSYDNSKSGLASNDLQNAVDELYDKAYYGDAGSGNILNGKTALVNGSKITGTMPDNKTWTSSPTTSTNVTIPAGYHNGLGYVDTSGVYNAGKTAYNPTSATLSNAGALSVKNAAGTQIYTNTFTNNYDSGRTQGRSDVTSSPGSYSLYTKSQYDTNYSNGQKSVSVSSITGGASGATTTTVSTTVTATASNGASKSGTIMIDASSIYTNGYNAGVAAASGTIDWDSFKSESMSLSATATAYSGGISSITKKFTPSTITKIAFVKVNSVAANNGLASNNTSVSVSYTETEVTLKVSCAGNYKPVGKASVIVYGT